MKLLSPTPYKRLNEALGFLYLSAGLVMLLSLVSYHAQDPSWNTASDAHPVNLVGYPGSYLSDALFQLFGAAAFLFPFLVFGVAWKWIRSEELPAGGVKSAGALLLALSLCAGLSFYPVRMFGGSVLIGGTVGVVLAHYLLHALNLAGALVAVFTLLVLSVYLVSTFSLARLEAWLAGPRRWLERRAEAFRALRARLRAKAVEKAGQRARRRSEQLAGETAQRRVRKQENPAEDAEPQAAGLPWEPAAEPVTRRERASRESNTLEEIPICPIEEIAPPPEAARPAPVPEPPARKSGRTAAAAAGPQSPAPVFQLPSTDLLNEPPGRNPYDEQELKDTAARIKAKFQ
ncbi:MAG TPA: DNA translocase FtsK 4TM domain-containing protein, partial [Bryobacteraceae bacterium]|nr:DNA translocase FtsK 4TM domain-containing protein [Bryobacteraceae bacterium]